MAANKGRFTKILVDDSGGTPTDISADVVETEGIPLTYDEIETGGFGSAAKSYISGRADTPVTLTGNFNSTTHAIFESWVGDDTDVRTVEFQYGQNAAPTTGDPQIDGEFICSEYRVNTNLDGVQQFTAKLALASGSAIPAWGTV
jgi:hypothetical protein